MRTKRMKNMMRVGTISYRNTKHAYRFISYQSVLTVALALKILSMRWGTMEIGGRHDR